MNRFFYLIFSFAFAGSIVGCKKAPVVDNTVYYINVTGGTDFASNGGDHLNPVNVSSKNANSIYHYFQADKGTEHISFGFIDSASDFKFTPGADWSAINTYTITRIDYGSGAAFGAYSAPDPNVANYEALYQTDYANDTGTLTVQYNQKLHQAKGTFSFDALQINPAKGNSPNLVSLSGTYLISWQP